MRLLLLLLILLFSVCILPSNVQCQNAEPCGAIGMASLNFHPDRPGFIKYVHDIEDSISYVHTSNLSDLDKHHARYPYDSYKSFTPDGVQRVIRDIDDPSRLAPSVVYVSGAKPWIGANFYTRCSNKLKIKAVWTFTAGGITRTLSFPEKPVTPQAVLGPTGGNLFLATYPYQESDEAIPQGFTLGFEEAEVVFFISEATSIFQSSNFSTTLTAKCDIYVLANSPILDLTFKVSSLLPRYSSIRNGCIYGNDTNNYRDWIDQMFAGYFEPRTVARRGKAGITLDYWKLDGRSSCSGLSEFFDNGNGRCGLFAAYLAEMVICQGYTLSNRSVMVVYVKGYNPDAIMQISSTEMAAAVDAAKAKYGLNTRVVVESYAAFGVLNQSPYMVGKVCSMRRNPFSSSLKNSEIIGAQSIIVPGQNNSFPRHLFENHVVFISEVLTGQNGNTYRMLYDPSYGVKFPHLLFPNDSNDPTDTSFHGVKHEEDAGISYVRAALATVTNLSTNRSFPIFVPLAINDQSELDLTAY